MKDPLSYQIQQLLKRNNILIDFDELSFQIKSHPTYPSLHSVTGVLDHFNIGNIALDVPNTTDTLEQLPKTFLAQVEIDEQKQFVVVTKAKDNYQLTYTAKLKKSLTQSQFLEQFTGIVLVVDKDESNLDNNNTASKTPIINVLKIVSVVLFITLLLNNTNDLAHYIFLSLSFIGIYLAHTILKQEQGISTVLGDAFCSNPSEKKNCNAVLSSKAATVFKNLKLSDVSSMYFIGLSLSTFLLAINNNPMFSIQLISLLALPAILYSIYYQAIIIKKWCLLCLGIVAILCIQALLSLISFQPIYHLESILISLLSFSFTSTFWLIKSDLLKDNKSLKKMKVSYYKFKRNFDLFITQLDKSKSINTLINTTGEIVLGNTNSNLEITIITNPLCGHCKPVHKTLEQILKNYSESVKLTIRFNVNSKNDESLAVKITLRLLELYNTKGPKICLEAMHEIYGKLSPKEWLKKWNYCEISTTYLPILQEQYSWCKDNTINFTPELLINGKSYPKIFDRSDLIYFIEELDLNSQQNSDPIDLQKMPKL